jgi:hypothetical protein
MQGFNDGWLGRQQAQDRVVPAGYFQSLKRLVQQPFVRSRGPINIHLHRCIHGFNLIINLNINLGLIITFSGPLAKST